MAEQSVIEAEVSGLIALSGLMLVFLPFFLDRLRSRSEGLPVMQLRLLRALAWLTALLVIVPAVGAILGLLTLWGFVALSGLIGGITVIAIGSVAAYTLLTVWLDSRVW